MQRKKYLIILYLLLLSVEVFGQRQILPDFEADPSAHVFGNTMWIYPSHDIPGSTGWDMVDWHSFSSKDLIHWKDNGVIFSLKDISWAKKYAWAPDCTYSKGKYYFYYPADDQIGVAVSKKPYGPFKDPLGKPLIAKGESGTRAIDPCIFMDDDGQAYLYFGQNDLRVVKLNKDMISRNGVIDTIKAPNYHEGIWVHKYNNNYYLSYPIFENGRANQLAYSIGKTPYGPFTYKGVILDNNSRNIHHSIVEFKHQWYIFYHIQGPSAYERRVYMEKLYYNADGTIKPILVSK